MLKKIFPTYIIYLFELHIFLFIISIYLQLLKLLHAQNNTNFGYVIDEQLNKIYMSKANNNKFPTNIHLLLYLYPQFRLFFSLIVNLYLHKKYNSWIFSFSKCGL